MDTVKFTSMVPFAMTRRFATDIQTELDRELVRRGGLQP